MSDRWGADNARDRSKGEQVELEAQRHWQLALYKVERHPYGVTGPDMRVTSQLGRGASNYVEVRGKYPNNEGCYGLEKYRLDTWRDLDVYYLVKDTVRRVWCIAKMSDLGEPRGGKAGSYRNGIWDSRLPNVYWPACWWMILDWEYS